MKIFRSPARTAISTVLLAALLVPLVAPADDWLIDAPDEQTRAERLSEYLGGFSKAMWEVGNRYEKLYFAITGENWQLAAYHWDKIGAVIRGGITKRPDRGANARALFLDDAWPKYLETLESGDREAIRAGFSDARAACMACHSAEAVGFMNDQALFSRLKLADQVEADPGYLGETQAPETDNEDAGPRIRFRICPDPDEPCWDDD